MMPAWLMLVGALAIGDPDPVVGPPANPTPPPSTSPNTRVPNLPPVAQNPEVPPIPVPIPPPKILSKPTSANPANPQTEKVDLQPVYAAGDTVKLKWTSISEDVREGAQLSQEQLRSRSETELYLTLKIEQVFPNAVYRCSFTVDRFVIDAPSFGGRDRFDSADSKTASSVFAGPARILLAKTIDFGVSGVTGEYLRREHPRLRVWYTDGINLYDNLFGYEAFPSRFGVLFGWLAPSAAVGESWQDQMVLRVSAGFSIDTLRTTTLLSDDGLTMKIGIKGVGQSAPDSEKKGLKFVSSTYDATYTVNSASAKIRSGESTHTYTFTYIWKGTPAKVTSTVRETLERVD